MVDVNRNIGCAGAHHSNHRDDELRRTRKCDAHEVARTNAPRFEFPRECVRAQKELAVGHPTLAIDDRVGIPTNARGFL